jgi:large subunit ribosomal protein L4e
MKAQIYSMDGKVKGSMEVPKIFEDSGRGDLVKKALMTKTTRQPYGSFARAGMEHSAHGIFKHRRRAWKGSYGIGIARTPSKVMSKRGTRFTRMGAFAANTRGGREAHPPKASKIWIGEINKKENRMALISALALNSSLDVLKTVYTRTDFSNMTLPLIVEDKVFELKKAKEIKNALLTILGNASGLLEKNILVVAEKKVKVKGLGFDVRKAAELNVLDMAPAGKPGRFIIFTEGSMKEMEKKWRL